MGKIKFGRRKLLLALPLMLGGVVLFYTACQKQAGTGNENSSPMIEEAKKYYKDVVVQKEKSMLSVPYSELPSYSNKRKFARMEKTGKIIDWNNAKEYSYNGEHYIVAPLIGNIKPFQNKTVEAARNIIFHKNGSGQMNMNIVEFVSKKDGTVGSNLQEMSAKAFVNKNFNKRDVIGNLTASIHFYDDSYAFVNSFQVNNGLWASTNNRLKNKNSPPRQRTVPTLVGRTTCQTCQTWYLVGIWYNTQTGQVTGYDILAEWDECTETGPPPSGYGTEPEPSTPPEQQCIDDNTDALNVLSSSAAVDNETISIEVTTIDNITKNKNPKWVILRSGGFWKLVSTELGVVKLVDVATNKWQWESLTHGSIEKQGVVIGGEVDVTTQTGTPSFTPGTQNILFAGMSLAFTVKYTVTPIPCPPFNLIIPPAYLDYQANAIWPATP